MTVAGLAAVALAATPFIAPMTANAAGANEGVVASAAARAAAGVATVGGQSYNTLSAALAAAKPGETVTLTADSSETVRVEKKITVTSANGAVYSGTMSVHDGATITGMTFALTGANGATTSVAVRGAGDVKITNNVFGVADNADLSQSYNAIHLSQGSARVVIEGNTFNFRTVTKNKDRVAVNIQGNPTISNVTVTNNTLNVSGDDAGKGSILLVEAFGNANPGYGITNLAVTDNKVAVPEGLGDNVQGVVVQGVQGLTFTGNTFTGMYQALGNGALPGQTSSNADVTAGGNDFTGTNLGYNVNVPTGGLTIVEDDKAPADRATIVAGVRQDDGSVVAYRTLSAAIDSIKDNGTVVLLADSTSGAVVPAGKTVTLDLDGFALSSAADHAVVNNGTLTIVDSSDAKSGKVTTTATGKSAVFNQGTATLEAGTFAGAEGADVVANGDAADAKLTIKGGTFRAAPKVAYVVKGFGLLKNADGTYGVAEAKLSLANEKVSYDVAKGELTGDAAVKLVDPKLNVEGYAVTADKTQLEAINQAIKDGKTEGDFTLTFTAAKDGVADDTLTAEATVTLTKQANPQPAPEVRLSISGRDVKDGRLTLKVGETRDLVGSIDVKSLQGAGSAKASEGFTAKTLWTSSDVKVAGFDKAAKFNDQDLQDTQRLVAISPGKATVTFAVLDPATGEPVEGLAPATLEVTVVSGGAAPKTEPAAKAQSTVKAPAGLTAAQTAVKQPLARTGAGVASVAMAMMLLAAAGAVFAIARRRQA
ncbi:hypothetical protein DF200_04890 [Bifidobacterium catulorum]|uniref:Gram-positive cocci surface proteins LPxTG domain-containing protein n=2 Tax=Bifidobacterium catulorum TaxID=1630173 RepID=A0A2U2MT01_9BIFI|nr:hypothetical protein DF200_04890 [Bifidobacterium catulorum]